MVNKIVGWLVLVPLCGLMVFFALANQQLVAIRINPFAAPGPAEAAGYGIPLFVVLYVVLLIGVLLGGTATWFAQGAHRRRERHWRREAQLLANELDARGRAGPGANSTLNEVDDMLELR